MKLKKIESEKEYYEQLKIYKKRISKLFRSGYKFISNPHGMIDKFENLLAEMEFIGLVTSEWSQEQRERLYRELNSPNEFREWVETSKNKMKQKFNQIIK